MPRAIHESDVEENVLAVLENLGYQVIRGKTRTIFQVVALR